MKLATRDKNLLVLVLVCVIVVCAYYFGYQRFSEEKVEEVQEEVKVEEVEIVEEHFELDGLEDIFDETEIKTDTDAEAV